jgi:hypothetical protein
MLGLFVHFAEGGAVRLRQDGPTTARPDPTRRQRGQYLRGLGRIIVSPTYGAEADCEPRWQESAHTRRTC